MSDLFPSWAEQEPAPLPVSFFRGRTILVSGAGGSLGTAVARILVDLPVQRIVLVDTSEHGLVRLKDRLQRTMPDESPDLKFILGDLRIAADRDRCLRTEPSVILHMAAYKHVPFLEDRPIAATQNNVLATADWLADCRAHNAVDRFTLVSTDKAVQPVGIMGATKAIAERLVNGIRRTETPGLSATTLRLCNVFGSRGSVVPRFCRRLGNGELLPVTHPDMERWFTTPAVAARSVLQTLRHEAGTYVPAMRQCIPILTLARHLVGWVRPNANPDNWIRRTEPRPGERLHEDVLAPNEHPGAAVEGELVQAEETAGSTMEHLRAHIDRLRQSCDAGDAETVREMLLTDALQTAVETTTS